MSPADYSDLYDQFTHTAFRLECRQQYGVPADDAAMRAFQAGVARPERSVRTSPWLARIAQNVLLDGKDWSRVRLVSWPLTEYTRFEMLGYVESQAVGERIALADASLVDYDGPDVWAFDLDSDHACAVQVDYTDDGVVRERHLVDEPVTLDRIRGVRDAAVAVAVPLNEFLAREVARKRA